MFAALVGLDRVRAAVVGSEWHRTRRRVPTDGAPVVIGDFLVDVFRLGDPPIQAVDAVATGAGDPELIAGLDIEIVGLEPEALETLERTAVVAERRASLGKRDAPNPGG